MLADGQNTNITCKRDKLLVVNYVKFHLTILLYENNAFAIISEYSYGTSLETNMTLSRIVVKKLRKCHRSGSTYSVKVQLKIPNGCLFLDSNNITEAFGKSYRDPFSDFQEEAQLNIGNKPADLLERTKEYCIMP